MFKEKLDLIESGVLVYLVIILIVVIYVVAGGDLEILLSKLIEN